MKFRSLCAVMVIGGLAVFLSHHPFSVDARNVPDTQAPQQSDANTALSRGRALLKQGRADQALGNLENALNLFTQARNQRGVAAAQDGLGDLYMIQGQYKVALDHYQKAYESFTVARNKDQENQAAANSAASRAGGNASALVETAGSLADNGF